MPSVADSVDAVIGGDTHSQFHQLEIAAPNGAVISTRTVSNDSAGFAAALEWITTHAPGPRVIVGLEGTRSYGIGLGRALAAAGLAVVEVEQPTRKARHRHGKSDRIDAHHAVLSVLGMDRAALPTPRADGDREALRILVSAYREITTTAVRHNNALRALLITGDDQDRTLANGTFTLHRLAQIARRRARTGESREQAVRRAEARRLAVACRDAYYARNAHRAQIEELVNTLAPGITGQRGVGPISAAQLLISFSHPGRCRNEAAFARLAGTAPLEATSGKTINRHRLNRGGDRQLNRALHDIARTRMIHCPETKAYVARRQAEGKTTTEIRRCLKRYIARQQFRLMTTTTT
jgi:transposase